MDFRHEWKIEINTADLLALRSRLRVLMEPDAHAVDGRYQIRSLYFDSLTDRALREKIDGVNRREKFRIRYYNGDTGFLSLEKKSKLNGLCNNSAERPAAFAGALLQNENRGPSAKGRGRLYPGAVRLPAGQRPRHL